MLKELSLGVRVFYAVLGALTLGVSAEVASDSMVVATIFLLFVFSFLHEFMFMRHLINMIEKVHHKLWGLLAIMVIAAGVSVYALYTLGHFNWVGEESEVVRRYAMWYGFYMVGFSVFISGAVVRRSMQHNKVV